MRIVSASDLEGPESLEVRFNAFWDYKFMRSGKSGRSVRCLLKLLVHPMCIRIVSSSDLEGLESLELRFDVLWDYHCISFTGLPRDSER